MVARSGFLDKGSRKRKDQDLAFAAVTRNSSPTALTSATSVRPVGGAGRLRISTSVNALRMSVSLQRSNPPL
jgi:hypothetical protein